MHMAMHFHGELFGLLSS